MSSQPTRLFELLEHSRDLYGRKDALVNKVNGRWIRYSAEESVLLAEQFALGLYDLGIRKGDMVGIVSENRPEWNFIDMGCLSLGVVLVPLYPTSALDQAEYILNDAGVKLFFVSTEELNDRFKSIYPNVKSCTKVFTINNVEGMPFWKDVLHAGEKLMTEKPGLIGDLKAAVSPDDLATLIYTSGTTGEPKGVMLTHANIVSNVVACTQVLDITPGKDKVLSFLPLCHSFERMVNYFYQYSGLGIYYAESMETIADNLKEVQPNLFTTVPRLLEKVYDKIVGKGAALKGIKRQLFFWALNLAKAYNPEKNQGIWYNFQLALANKLIFSKWREALGGNLSYIVAGGAALSPKLATVFTAGRILILQGYGLTETSPVISVNKVNRNRIGSIGPVIPNVQVKIGEDGEILATGPNIMRGYYNKPEATAEVIRDGWFHTGDIGHLDADGFLYITDRKKEIFKTSGGKYIAPQPIENELKSSRFIEQAMVIGEGHKFPAAFIVPSFLQLTDHFRRKHTKLLDNYEMIHNPEVIDLLEKEVARVNERLSQTDKIKKFRLLHHEWTIDSGELTPTLKPRRKVILQKYATLADDIYANEDLEI
ncbi:MAG: long-chain fatty acid--CoA ligase [Bacteroidetes bacterium]|nr:long-chain fatty acid--CoA ligase [Bacteroidota bacterium]